MRPSPSSAHAGSSATAGPFPSPSSTGAANSPARTAAGSCTSRATRAAHPPPRGTHHHRRVRFPERRATTPPPPRGGGRVGGGVESNEILSALQGIKVVDLCIVLAGPTCGRTLAEFGADVIRID